MRATLISLFLLLPSFSFAQSPSPELKETQDRLKVLEDRLNKLEGAPAKTSLSAFNPAMGMALDTAFSGTNDKARFFFRAAEVSLEAPIDPFLKGWAILTGSAKEFGVEEAALQTTALPWNLTVTGGRLFASFGRLAHFHDHELPVIDRPRSLDTYIGGETQADGLEATVLFPTPFYLTGTVGAYNKIGGENGRADNAAARPLDEFTYLTRLNASGELGESHSLELGVDLAWTPKRTVQDTSVQVDLNGDGTPDLPNVSADIFTRENTYRTLAGADLTYRYQPAQGGGYRGLVWSTEVMQNHERRFDPVTNLPTDRVRAYAGFSYVEVKLGRHWRPGLLVDLSEDLDRARSLTKTLTGFLTYDVTEFQRLRLAFTQSMINTPGALKNHTVALQWTGVLGHHVHGFRGR